ncbi:GerMN domain-containing protein [Paenibacillus pinistramenti]|uniref:GerMN domain-containing protein n=1 Tax=Paenibacillus pinistramenti TaxID=1768003 RepID=UPI001109C94D|nr:GerMN domain-containing protein [Paenibacillus pinistramenti]
MNKKHWTILLSLLLMAAIAGCGQKPAAAPATSGDIASANGAAPAESEDSQNGDGTSETSSSTVPESPAPSSSEEAASTDEQITETIKLYYADQDFVDLKETTRQIQFEDSEDSAGKYKAAFEALQDSTDSGLVSLWAKVQLLSVKFADGEVTIDIHLPDEARLGSDGELMALESLQKTMFQFNEVTSIELLVDGQQLETLMGHADLLHPMTRE